MQVRCAPRVFETALETGGIKSWTRKNQDMATPYGMESILNTTRAGNQNVTSITALADGGYLVVYDDDDPDPDGDNVRAQRYDTDGNALGDEILVNDVTDLDQWDGSVAELPNGFVVTWTDASADRFDPEVKIKIFNWDGTASRELPVRNNSPERQNQPEVTALDDGRFVVTWSDENTGSGDVSQLINARIYTVTEGGTGAIGGPIITVSTVTSDVDGSGPDGDSRESSVTALSDGFVVTWNDAGEIYGRIFDSEGNSVRQFKVTDVTDDGEVKPSVAELAGGGFVVVWSYAGINSTVRGQVFDENGDKVGQVFDVNLGTDAFVAALPDGGFVVAWQQKGSDGDKNGILAQVFNDDGTKRGPEFDVNTTTFRDQENPVIAALADGGFIIAWDDDSQGIGTPNAFDVRAQVFKVEITSDGGGDAAALTFSENVTGPVTTVDANGDDTQFSIVGGADASLFEIDADTGELRFIASPDFENPADAGGDNTYGVEVQASDDIFSDTQAISVAVTNVPGQTLIGTRKKDTLVGTGEEDVLFGRRKKDKLFGEEGEDVLVGGRHKDKLTGGADADSFVFNSKLKNKWADKIKDFEVGEDVIVLDRDVFAKTGKSEILKDKFFDTGRKADSDKERILYQEKKGWLRYDMDGEGGDKAVKFAKVGKNLDLSADDFLMI